METTNEIAPLSTIGLEKTYLAWITMASIFLAAALVLVDIGNLYAIGFLVISIIILLIANLDHLNSRSELVSDGIRPMYRTNLLFGVVILALAIQVVLLMDLLFRPHCNGRIRI